MTMKKRTRILLLIGMAMMIPCYLFIAGNTLLAPWTLYPRSRKTLILLCGGMTVLLYGMLRGIGKVSEKLERHERPIIWGALTLLFAVQIMIGLAFRHQPFTDAEQCWTAAQLIADTGTFAGYERATRYFAWYPHNLGFVYLLTAVFRFGDLIRFPDRYALVLVLGSALFTGGMLCGLGMAKRLGGIKAEMRFLALCLLTPVLWYFPAELYTDAFSLAFPPMVFRFALGARDAVTKRSRLLWLLAAALAAFIGSQIRFTCLIAAIACVLAFLFDGKAKQSAVLTLLLALVFVGGGALVSREHGKHIDPEYMASRKLPKLHYIVMGFPAKPDDGYGSYGEGYWLTYSDSFEDAGERSAALLDKLKDRVYYVRYPDRLLNLLSRKNSCTFGDGTFGLGRLIQADDTQTDGLKSVVYQTGKHYPVYYHLCTALFAAQLLLSCLSCLKAVRKGNTAGAMVYLSLLGIYLFLCIWETQPRYFFQYLPVLLMAVSLHDDR